MTLAERRPRAGCASQSFKRSALTYGLLTHEELARLEMVPYDLEDPASLPTAIGRARRVICAAAATGGESAQRVDGAGTIALIDAAAQVGVRQFVLVSQLGGGGLGGLLSGLTGGGALKWKRKAEEALQASGLPYVILRPGVCEALLLPAAAVHAASCGGSRAGPAVAPGGSSSSPL